MESAQENIKLEQEIIEGKAELDKIVDVPAKVEVAIDEKALDQVVSDDQDPDKAHRLYLAMQRTNAVHMDTAFHFFNTAPEPLHPRLAFPRKLLPNHRWTSVLEGAGKAHVKGLALTWRRCTHQRSGFRDRLRPTDLPHPQTPSRASLVDDRAK